MKAETLRVPPKTTPTPSTSFKVVPWRWCPSGRGEDGRRHGNRGWGKPIPPQPPPTCTWQVQNALPASSLGVLDPRLRYGQLCFRVWAWRVHKAFTCHMQHSISVCAILDVPLRPLTHVSHRQLHQSTASQNTHHRANLAVDQDDAVC